MDHCTCLRPIFDFILNGETARQNTITHAVIKDCTQEFGFLVCATCCER